MAGSRSLRAYQASVTLPATLQRIQGARERIARLGGEVEILPTATPGLTIVRLLLPKEVTPEAAVPGVPFFPL